jgi:CRISPR-associated protein Cmr6
MQGRAVFFDAVLQEARFDLDVVAPHHTPYYEQGKPPADWYAPTPHFYLVVTQGTAHLAVAMTPPRRDDEPDSDSLLACVRAWTLKALHSWGVGAKTRLGYGRFAAPGLEQQRQYRRGADSGG